MSFAHWKMKVAEWRKAYPLPPIEKGKFNPGGVRILAAACAYCGSRKKVHRHHKGHEFLFACIAPEKYAGRYILFLPEDTVPLCRIHHQYIHRKYEKTIKELNIALSLADPYAIDLEPYRLQLIAICDKWLARKHFQRVKKR